MIMSAWGGCICGTASRGLTVMLTGARMLQCRVHSQACRAGMSLGHSCVGGAYPTGPQLCRRGLPYWATAMKEGPTLLGHSYVGGAYPTGRAACHHHVLGGEAGRVLYIGEGAGQVCGGAMSGYMCTRGVGATCPNVCEATCVCESGHGCVCIRVCM